MYLFYVADMGSPSSTEDISITVKDGEAAILNPPSVQSVPAASVSWQKIGFGRLHGINYAVTLNNDLVLLATSKDGEGQYQASLTNSHAGQETSGGMVLLHVIGIYCCYYTLRCMQEIFLHICDILLVYF